MDTNGKISTKEEIVAVVQHMLKLAKANHEPVNVTAQSIVETVYKKARFREEITPEKEHQIIELLRQLPRLTYKSIGERTGVSASLVNRVSRNQSV